MWPLLLGRSVYFSSLQPPYYTVYDLRVSDDREERKMSVLFSQVFLEMPTHFSGVYIAQVNKKMSHFQPLRGNYDTVAAQLPYCSLEATSSRVFNVTD